MKVTIELKEVEEPFAVIYTKKIDEDITEFMNSVEQIGKSSTILAKQEEKYIILKPEEIYMARVEADIVMIYTKDRHYVAKGRLREIEKRLGNEFMRISKTTIINLHQIESVEPSFSGTMFLRLKNEQKDYISRKYLPGFKHYLGL